MSTQESRIQSLLIARAVAEHRDAVAKLTPLGGPDVLAAARRHFDATSLSGRARRKETRI
jgi:hypothetical protein